MNSKGNKQGDGEERSQSRAAAREKVDYMNGRLQGCSARRLAARGDEVRLQTSYMRTGRSGWLQLRRWPHPPPVLILSGLGGQAPLHYLTLKMGMRALSL